MSRRLVSETGDSGQIGKMMPKKRFFSRVVAELLPVARDANLAHRAPERILRLGY
jgi:hypothetical protein